MISDGHEVALHCERHLRHTTLTTDEILTDTKNGLEDLARLGVRPESWRPPWGIVTAGTRRAEREFELELELWTSDTHDWRGDEAGAMLEAVSGGSGGGSVVLMHDGLGPGATRGDCRETLALIPLLLEDFARRGLETSTVSELRAFAFREGRRHP